MELLLSIFMIIPLVGLIINMLIPSERESMISKGVYVTSVVQLMYAFVFVAFWLFKGHPLLASRDLVLFRTPVYEVFIDFYFDKISMAYLLVGSIVTFLIIHYNRLYMEKGYGYKRFFNTMLLFCLGYNLTVISGNLETLFLGWEILAISSFLLIAFYRDRSLTVNNAVKVFSISRLGDVGIILAAWATHHFWHGNFTFLKLNNYELLHSQYQTAGMIGVIISLMIVFSAIVKSAQFPFSSWLTKSMEGPTPASAIFYASLSVHIGIFLLLRTSALWEHQLSVRILIGVTGFLTAVIANAVSRVQVSAKGQIAYSSVFQIGLIFMELSAGFENMALFHFAGNAFFRTYQLIVLPHVDHYPVRESFFSFKIQTLTANDSFFKRIKNSFYVLCLKEWHLDEIMNFLYWDPLTWVGRKLDFITIKKLFLFFIPAYLLGLYYVYHKELIPFEMSAYVPFLFAFMGLWMVLKSFSEKRNVQLCWILLIMNHFWVSLAIGFNDAAHFNQIQMYMVGIAITGVLGFLILQILKGLKAKLDLEEFHGHIYGHPKLGIIFLLLSLVVSCFPITPAFIGKDLIYSHTDLFLAFIISLSFVINGLSMIRIYACVFLGPHESAYGTADKSS
jgi:NADH-quinone oxidoreductase subunit L